MDVQSPESVIAKALGAFVHTASHYTPKGIVLIGHRVVLVGAGFLRELQRTRRTGRLVLVLSRA